MILTALALAAASPEPFDWSQVPPPPTPEQRVKYRRCLKRWVYGRRVGQAADGIISAGMVASGAAEEMNPLLSWAGPPGIIAGKVLVTLFIEGETRKHIRRGEYKKACDLNRWGTILSFGWVGGVL